MSSNTHPLNALSAYRDLPAISGRAFLPISLFGRLPVAMAPVAILTYVATLTGDFAAAGLAATAVALGSAVGAPLTGMLADRIGQRPVLSAAVLLNAAALVALAIGPSTVPAVRLILCAVVGLSLPQVGGMSRARWLALTRTRLSTAFAFEGTADELSFVLGPALAGLLATLWGPEEALLAAAVLVLSTAGAFAVHPTHAAVRRNVIVAAERLSPRRLLSVIAVPLGGVFAMGVLFVSVETAVTAYGASIGRPSAGGLLYALMAVGSALTASLMPIVPDRIELRTRFVVSSAGLLAGVVLMIGAVALGVVALGITVLVTGLFVGPLLITVNGLVASQVSPEQGASAMTLVGAGVVCGIAAGALAAGNVTAAHGPVGALGVALAATTALTALTVLTLFQRRAGLPK